MRRFEWYLITGLALTLAALAAALLTLVPAHSEGSWSPPPRTHIQPKD